MVVKLNHQAVGRSSFFANVLPGMREFGVLTVFSATFSPALIGLSCRDGRVGEKCPISILAYDAFGNMINGPLPNCFFSVRIKHPNGR